MEKKLNTRFNAFLYKFKDDVKTHITQELGKDITPQMQSKIMKYIYSYEGISITKEDLQRRKRVKNIVPLHCRCCAKRANGEQCTRRRKDESIFCGTHIKGTPHGKMDDENITPIEKKVTVWAQDINGIIYYIDNNKNVYDPQDILDNKINPTVIAKWEKGLDENGQETEKFFIKM
jgi:hypothetical protein|tara:strand:- start:754 stop:1281 length:528 start_codon:yes stop_codon:yes gene_type:complete